MSRTEREHGGTHDGNARRRTLQRVTWSDDEREALREAMRLAVVRPYVYADLAEGTEPEWSVTP